MLRRKLNRMHQGGQGEIDKEKLTADRAMLLNRIERIKAASSENKANAETATAAKEKLTADRAMLLNRIERIKTASSENKANAETATANKEKLTADRAMLLNRIERIKATSNEYKNSLATQSNAAADWASNVSAALAESIAGLEGTTVSTDSDNSVLVQVGNNGLFRTGSTSLSNDGSQLLASIAREISQQDANITVVGHTDNIPVGSANRYADNEELSFARASSTLQFLRNEGVATERLAAAGYGADYPIASNLTEEGRQQNRRVEIVLRQR